MNTSHFEKKIIVVAFCMELDKVLSAQSLFEINIYTTFEYQIKTTQTKCNSHSEEDIVITQKEYK